MRLFSVCPVATAAETKSHYRKGGKKDATVCYKSVHLVLIVCDFLFGYRRSPAANQPSVTKVCLSGEFKYSLSICSDSGKKGQNCNNACLQCCSAFHCDTF